MSVEPSCLNIGPNSSDSVILQNELEYFEWVCKGCSYADGCKWVRDFYFDDLEDLYYEA